MMVRIREGKVGDITQIMTLGKEAADLSPVYHGLEMDDQKVRRYLAMMIASKLHHVGVLEIDGNIQGALLGHVSSMLWMKGRQVGDQFFYVRPQFAGRARSLVKQFLSWAKEKPNVNIIGLSTSFGDNLERTGKFFESCGLKKIGGIFILDGDS